jgi:hypothetical protein
VVKSQSDRRRTLLKWLLPAKFRLKLWAYFQAQLASRPRRWLLCCGFFVSFYALDGIVHLQALVSGGLSAWTDLAKGTKVSTSGKVDFAFLDLLKILGQCLPVVWRGLLSLAIGIVLPEAVGAMISEEKGLPEGTKEKVDSLVGLLEERAGIVAVYPAELHKAISDQPYAQPILKALNESSTLRILSIAGYEYLGKGAESLLYKTIAKKPGMGVEVIILDPDKGMDVINERVACLKANRENTLSVSEIQRQIGAMRRTLSTLKGNGRPGSVELCHCKHHPVFRAILLDDCLFFSTYDANAHGHETPVFKVERQKEKASLFEAFDQLYKNTRAQSKKGIRLHGD